MLNSEKSLSFFINESKTLNIENLPKKIKIGLLSSFTINGLKEVLNVKSFEHSVSSSIYEGPYNQYSQEILNPSSHLYQFNPDIVFLIIDSRTIFDQLYYFPFSKSIDQKKSFIDDKISEIKNLITSFTKQSNAMLLFCFNLETKFFPINPSEPVIKTLIIFEIIFH